MPSSRHDRAPARVAADSPRSTSGPWERHRQSAFQLLKFAVVGGSGVIVNMAVNIVMNKLNGGTVNARDVIFPLPGTQFNLRFTHLTWIVPFLVANVWNFQLNRSWTFKSSKFARWRAEFWPFLAVGSVAGLAGLGLKALMMNPTTIFYLPSEFFDESVGLRSREYWSQLIAIALTLPINFVVNKVWTFKSVRKKPTALSGAAEVGEAL